MWSPSLETLHMVCTRRVLVCTMEAYSGKWTQSWTEEGSQETWNFFCCWVSFLHYNLHWFPMADVINYHKLGDLKQ